MNSICKTIFATALLSVVSARVLFAQLQTSKYEVGIQAGTLVYQGDLSTSFIGSYKSLKPAVGVFIARSIDPYFSVRASFTRGKISDNDLNYTTPAWKQNRAFNFSSGVTELSAMLVFNPFGTNTDRRLSPYVFGGGGVTFLSIKRDWSKYNPLVFDAKSQVQIGLGIDTLHAPPGAIAILPVGAGIRYALTSQLFLNAEATYRFTATDYLDGFKYAGNADRRDNYYGLSIGISYRFSGYKCPPVHR